MSIFRELWEFMRARKKFWLMPIFLIMLLLGGLAVVDVGGPDAHGS